MQVMVAQLAFYAKRAARVVGFVLFFLAAAATLVGQTPAVQNPGSVVVNGYALSGVVTMPVLGATPVFDGSKGICFVGTISTAVTSSTVVNMVPGQVYTFEIVQGATPYAFVWPKNFYNAQSVPTKANYIQIEIGVALSDGSVLGIQSIGASI